MIQTKQMKSNKITLEMEEQQQQQHHLVSILLLLF